MKFGSDQATARELSSANITDKDVESRGQDHNIELGPIHLSNEPILASSDVLKALSAVNSRSTVSSDMAQRTEKSQLEVSPEIPESLQRPISPTNSASAKMQPQQNDAGEGSSRVFVEGPSRPGGQEDVVPASIGRETCPICIVDFEEGDDIRVLPCEGNHCFHQTCVDPWLLELSSSCPICRHGMCYNYLNRMLL